MLFSNKSKLFNPSNYINKKIKIYRVYRNKAKTYKYKN